MVRYKVTLREIVIILSVKLYILSHCEIQSYSYGKLSQNLYFSQIRNKLPESFTGWLYLSRVD